VYHGVAVKSGKGVPHARAVARALRLVGCSVQVQVAGLLHDVVEDTTWTVGDVDARFGRAVAELVQAVSEDDAIVDYRARKRALREQIARGGADAIDIALADTVATLDYSCPPARSSPSASARTTRLSRRSARRRRIQPRGARARVAADVPPTRR
jgi:HD domain-containing protein